MTKKLTNKKLTDCSEGLSKETIEKLKNLGIDPTKSIKPKRFFKG